MFELMRVESRTLMRVTSRTLMRVAPRTLMRVALRTLMRVAWRTSNGTESRIPHPGYPLFLFCFLFCFSSSLFTLFFFLILSIFHMICAFSKVFAVCINFVEYHTYSPCPIVHVWHITDICQTETGGNTSTNNHFLSGRNIGGNSLVYFQLLS